MEEVVLTFDLGGTNISAAIIDSSGRIISDIITRPTLRLRPKEETILNLFSCGRQALEVLDQTQRLAAIATSIKSPFDIRTGQLKVPSLPNLIDVDIASLLRNEFGAPVFLENNANCFALGEALHGAGQGSHVVLAVNLGTGFGIGTVIGGKIYRGDTGNAGEMEWCKLNGIGFDEALSAGGVLRFLEGPSSDLSPLDVADMARRGDTKAVSAWLKFGKTLGDALSIVAAVIDPGVIVFGGSGSLQFELFNTPLTETLRSTVAPQAASSLSLKTATLGRSAALIGAYLNYQNCLGRSDNQRGHTKTQTRDHTE